MSQAVELFWISGSPFPWRVQLALAIHGVDYISHRLNASEYEHKQPEYLALNPRGKVPVLRDGDFVVRESIAILVYLNAKYPQWQLFGETARERAMVWQQICEVENHIVHWMREFIRPILFGGLDKKRQEVLAASHFLVREFEQLDKTLSQQPWLAGNKCSAADLVTYPLVKFVERVATRERTADLPLKLLPYSQRNPNLHGWIGRLEGLPGVADTYPPHWQA